MSRDFHVKVILREQQGESGKSETVLVHSTIVAYLHFKFYFFFVPLPLRPLISDS